MKREYRTAWTRGAKRGVDMTTGTVPMHPAHNGLYVYSVLAANTLDLLLPRHALTKLRNGVELTIHNIGIGGNGPIRVVDQADLFWDFTNREWIEVATVDCEIGPSDIAIFAIVAWQPPIEEGGDLPYDPVTYENAPLDATWVPVWEGVKMLTGAKTAGIGAA